MLLRDKIVIVSGIGPGLGIELALNAARERAHVVIAARTASKLDEAEARIQKLNLGTQVLKVPTDITQVADCKQLAEQAMEKFGRIDCLINSAYNPGKFELIEHGNLDNWRSAMDVNLYGTMNMSKAVIPAMKEQRAGSIVNINTMVTRKPFPTQAGYAASKAALRAATAHLALEVGKYGIRVNSAFMGWMWGPPVEYYLHSRSQAQGASFDELKKEIESNIPLGRIPTDDECANAALFLASDYASAITGACLDVNGGEYMDR